MNERLTDSNIVRSQSTAAASASMDTSTRKFQDQRREKWSQKKKQKKTH